MVSSITSGCESSSSTQEEVDMELQSIRNRQTQSAVPQLTNRVTQSPMPNTGGDSTNRNVTTIGDDMGGADGPTHLLVPGQAFGSPSTEVATDSVATINTAGDDPTSPGQELLVIGRQPAPAPLQILAVAAAGDLINHAPGPALIVHALPANQMPGDVNVPDEPADAGPDLTPGDVDLGWGIVVGALSLKDFNEILSFPVICDE